MPTFCNTLPLTHEVYVMALLASMVSRGIQYSTTTRLFERIFALASLRSSNHLRLTGHVSSASFNSDDGIGL